MTATAANESRPDGPPGLGLEERSLDLGAANQRLDHDGTGAERSWQIETAPDDTPDWHAALLVQEHVGDTT